MGLGRIGRECASRLAHAMQMEGKCLMQGGGTTLARSTSKTSLTSRPRWL